MTYAPKPIQAARAYLLARLDAHPGRAIAVDLDPNEVGIVGDTKHGTSGYHVGWDRLRLGRGDRDYSVRESRRDHTRSDAASALDIGLFATRAADGSMWDLPRFSRWLVAQCENNAPDTRDIREVIYSPDGHRVHRWDRLGTQSGGDNGHLIHTHLSFFRDSENRDKTALFRRFVTECLEVRVSTPAVRPKPVTAANTAAAQPPKEIDMPFHTVELPSQFAFDHTGASLPAGPKVSLTVPALNAPGNVVPTGHGYLTLGCDGYGLAAPPARYRVAVFNGKSWEVGIADLDPAGTAVSWRGAGKDSALPDGATKVSVGRVRLTPDQSAGDIAASLCLEIGPRA
jgi:hypothetical protein